MKSSDEIKKGLECCRESQDCTQDNMPKCPYYEKETCLIELVDDALALIQQLEAELKDEKNNHQHTIEVAERMKAKIEKLKAVVIKLNSERNEAVIKNQQLEEERDDMLETIKRMVTCGADCGGCVHLVAANATIEQCEDIDFDCENCKEKCACYGCENGSNYVWKGTEDSPEKE